MNLCDINVWIALSYSDHSHHDACEGWFSKVDQPASVTFCRATQQGFLRLLTNAAATALYGDLPLSNRQAWTLYDAFLRDDRIVARFDEPEGLEQTWRRLTDRPTASHRLWMDAYLAAFAIAGGMTLVTTDCGFRQFEDLDLVLIDGS